MHTILLKLYEIFIKHQLLHVSGPTGTSSGNTQLYEHKTVV